MKANSTAATTTMIMAAHTGLEAALRVACPANGRRLMHSATGTRCTIPVGRQHVGG